MTFDPDTPPTAQELDTAGKILVKDETGADVTFASLINPGAAPTTGEAENVGGSKSGKKVIFIAIRHFYCGLCMDFLSFLSSKVTPEMLAAQNVSIVVLGCGDWSMIKPYRELLSLPFPVYADSDKKIYTALGMTLRTLDQGKFERTPEYIIRSMWSNAIGSIRSAFKMGRIGKHSGDLKQLGGEFVFGPNGEVLFTHRMENTRGHSKVADLMKAANVPYESSD